MSKRVIGALLTFMLLFSGSAMLSGCNTMEGAGKDIQSAGEGIEESAQDAK